MLHLVGRYPARSVEFGLNLLAAHLLGDIRNSDPKHTNWRGPVTSFVVNRQFNLVGLVDIDAKRFILKPVGARGLCSRFYRIFDLENHKRLGASGEPGTGSMVDVLNSLNA